MPSRSSTHVTDAPIRRPVLSAWRVRSSDGVLAKPATSRYCPPTMPSTPVTAAGSGGARDAPRPARAARRDSGGAPWALHCGRFAGCAVCRACEDAAIVARRISDDDARRSAAGRWVLVLFALGALVMLGAAA